MSGSYLKKKHKANSANTNFVTIYRVFKSMNVWLKDERPNPNGLDWLVPSAVLISRDIKMYFVPKLLKTNKQRKACN